MMKNAGENVESAQETLEREIRSIHNAMKFERDKAIHAGSKTVPEKYKELTGEYKVKQAEYEQQFGQEYTIPSSTNRYRGSTFLSRDLLGGPVSSSSDSAPSMTGGLRK